MNFFRLFPGCVGLATVLYLDFVLGVMLLNAKPQFNVIENSFCNQINLSQYPISNYQNICLSI